MSNKLDQTTLFHLSEALAQLSELYADSSTTFSGVVTVMDNEGNPGVFVIEFKGGEHQVAV